jgi:hypothetical protein
MPEVFNLVRAAYLDDLPNAGFLYPPIIDDAVRTSPPPANGTLIVTTPACIIWTGYLLDVASLGALVALIRLLIPRRRTAPPSVDDGASNPRAA